MDNEGLNVSSGIERCPDPQLIYVTPSHQYPLGSTLSLSRRLALVKLAARCGAWVIEDDYDSEFRYVGRPLAALQGLDTEQRVIYIGTLSKVMFPSIRIGYIVAPPDLFDALLSARCLGGINRQLWNRQYSLISSVRDTSRDMSDACVCFTPSGNRL